MKTSIVILIIMIIFFILGTIFPQGVIIDEYITQGGRYVFVIEKLGLLHIFHTPLFLIVSLLFSIHLAICLFDRAKGFPKSFDKILTWTYHLGILLLLIGILLSYLYAYEDEVMLYKGEKYKIASFELELKEFITEYTQFFRLKYPKGLFNRIKYAFSNGPITNFWHTKESENTINYTQAEASYFPKDWKSSLIVYDRGKAILNKLIEVNDPLHYKGFTFYQMGFEQRFDLYIDDVNMILFNLETSREFSIPSIENTFILDTIDLGKLFKLDGKTEELTPSADLFQIINGEKRKISRLVENTQIDILGHKIILRNIRENSLLSYRYDPGVYLLWFSSILLLLAMSIKLYWHMMRI